MTCDSLGGLLVGWLLVLLVVELVVGVAIGIYALGRDLW